MHTTGSEKEVQIIVQQNSGKLIPERKDRGMKLIDTQEFLKTGAVCRSSQTQ
jgi:hypothetical protein